MIRLVDNWMADQTPCLLFEQTDLTFHTFLRDRTIHLQKELCTCLKYSINTWDKSVAKICILEIIKND